MPKIFKALATIGAWVLFIAGLGYLVTTLIQWATSGFATGDWQQQAAFNGLGVGSVILSIVAMKLRKMLE
jgi:hypothetical protein